MIETSLLYVGAGTLLGLVLKSLWKKSAIETEYVTEERCRQCREECRQIRLTERNELREEMRSLGKSIDELRRTVIDMLKKGN